MTRRESADIGADLKQWLLRNDMTEQELADAVNSKGSGTSRVGQPWISRICNGRFKRIAGNTRAVLEYANIPVAGTVVVDTQAQAIIEAAVDEVWDGSFESARVIARLLRDAAALAQLRG